MSDTIVVKCYGKPEMSLCVGSTVLERVRSSTDEPDKLVLRKVVKICGGAVRSWLVLDDGQERDEKGYNRGKGCHMYRGSLEAFDEAVVRANDAEWIAYYLKQDAISVVKGAWQALDLKKFSVADLSGIADFLKSLKATP